MTIPAPKLDPRTYGEMVQQLVDWAEFYTRRQVDSNGELEGCVLAEDLDLSIPVDGVSGGKVSAGTIIDSKLAALIRTSTQRHILVKGWQGHPDNPDLGYALIRIYGRLMTIVQDRLNQSLDKNFLAFLDLIGTQINPPQPARVPLTFYLAENSSADGFVPAHTQIAAVLNPNEAEEVVFETTQNLVVTPSQLKAAMVWDVTRKREGSEAMLGAAWCDRTPTALGNTNTPFPAFHVTAPRAIYINCGELSPEVATTHLIISTTERPLSAFNLEWSYWSGESWQVLEDANATGDPPPETTPFRRAISTFSSQLREIDELEGHWLRLRETGGRDLPDIQNVLIEVTKTHQAENLSLDQAFFNDNDIDLSKDFYPFGEQPRFNDTFYLASREGFSKSGKSITLQIMPSAPYPIEGKGGPSPDGVQIQWETWDGNSWVPIGISTSNQGDAPTNAQNFRPNDLALLKGKLIAVQALLITNAATERSSQTALQEIQSIQRIVERLQSSTISPTPNTSDDPLQNSIPLTLHSTIAEATVNGESNYWLRGRLIAGNYGRSPSFSYEKTGSGENATLNLVQDQDSGYAPPILKSVTLSFNHTTTTTTPAEYRQVIADDMPIHLASERELETLGNQSALYLGFDRPFSNRAIALYLQVAAPTDTDLADLETVAEPAQLTWEYTSSTGWARLPVQDDTQTLTERGTVEFVGPTDFIEMALFGRTCHWLRLRYTGDFRMPPRLQRILTNTVWAAQVAHLKTEVLGSGNGNPGQRLTTLQAPVLPGQQLEVREPEMPSAQAQAILAQEEGSDAITIITDDSGQAAAIWVRWHEVRDFYTSTPADRHYTLNRLTGEVTFGDGQQGLMPPQGLNNVRLQRYRAGGGVQGNRGTDTISELRTSLPFIDRVTNLEPASGGAPQESLDRVKERGPKQLRHRQRAVTTQDFEDLAYEASVDVALVRAIAPDIQPQFSNVWNPLSDSYWLDPNSPVTSDHRDRSNGRVIVLIVPQSDDRQPIPSLGLLDRVEGYLTQQSSPLLSVSVSGPRWQEISVIATIVPRSNDVIDALRVEIQSCLTAFLHPLTGGFKHQGWSFGQHPYRSLFYQLLEAIPNVDHVRSLQVEGLIDRLPPDHLIYSGTHTIHFSLSP